MYICRYMYMFIIEYTFINLISKYFVLNFIITILSIFVLSYVLLVYWIDETKIRINLQ